MQADKWIKRLRREATANPKKAAALGLLLVVALYFWAPLLRGWIGKNESAAKIATAPPTSSPGVESQVPPVGTPTAKPPQEKNSVYTWEEWDKWINQDPRTKAATELLGRRDPFQPVRRVVVEKKDVKRSVEPVHVVVTPASLGMQLSSTVVGPSPRLATVNGKVYREGETIVASKDGRKTLFTLVEVRARQVILSSQNERFELNLAERKRSGRLELSSSQQ